MQYPDRTIERAKRAIRCSPFKAPLFLTLADRSVPLLEMVGELGVQHHYTQRALPELWVESDLLWLIQVGVLRREVDGQGITDCFRLTPLGQQLVEEWQQTPPLSPCPWDSPNWLDRLQNSVQRWLRLPLT